MNIINEQIWSDFANNLKSDQSRKEYRHAIEEITEYLGKPFLEITALDSQAYFNQLQTKNMKRSTILVRQAKLRSFSNFLLKNTAIYHIDYAFNPFVRINFMPEPPKHIEEQHVPSIEEMDSLLSRSSRNPEIFLVLSLIIKCGLSVSEICHIKIDDFYLDQANIPYLKVHARRKDRNIKITNDLVDILNDYFRYARPDEYLFENRNGKQLRIRDLERHFQKAIPDSSYTLSDIRNGSIASMLSQGIPEKTVAEYLGIMPNWLRRYENVIPELGLQAIDLNHIVIRK